MKAESLLVGADFGDTTQSTIDFSVDLAKRLGCKLELCHVMEALPYAYHSATPLAAEQMLRENAEELQRLASLVDGCSAEALPPEVGKPHHFLREKACSREALAVVIGAACKPTLERVVVGVTAEKIVQSAVRPVFLCHPADTHTIKHILCCVDYSEHAARTLRNAAELARRLGADLEVLHVETKALQGADLYSYESFPTGTPCHQPDTERLRCFVRDTVSGDDLPTTVTIKSGAPVHEILEACDSSNADLLVVGSHGAGGFVHRILGNVTTRIIRDVPCSVLVIGEEDMFPA